MPRALTRTMKSLLADHTQLVLSTGSDLCKLLEETAPGEDSSRNRRSRFVSVNP